MGTTQRPRGRHSIRLQDFDYSLPGAYFITTPTFQRLPVLGWEEEGGIHLSKIGEIVRACWCDIPEHYPYVSLDAYVVMPNHLHGLLPIVGARHGVPQQEAFGKPVPGSIPSIVR
ncbi:MAG: transposase, partial [Chloroflexi bacterium]|nr:transposase [Chloroflexota bacterium]